MVRRLSLEDLRLCDGVVRPVVHLGRCHVAVERRDAVLFEDGTPAKLRRTAAGVPRVPADGVLVVDKVLVD